MTDHEDAILNESRVRLEGVAAGLLRRLDPVPVASSFLAIGATILATYLGTEKAVTYLRELADGLEADEKGDGDGGPVGTA